MPHQRPARASDLFDVMHTMRAMRRLKPDPVPDDLWSSRSSRAGSGGGERRQHAALEIPRTQGRRHEKEGGAGVLQAALRRGVGPSLCVERAAAGLQPRRLCAPARRGQIPHRPLSRSAGVDRRLPRRRKPELHRRLIDLSGGSEHAAGDARARPRLDADHAPGTPVTASEGATTRWASPRGSNPTRSCRSAGRWGISARSAAGSLAEVVYLDDWGKAYPRID